MTLAHLQRFHDALNTPFIDAGSDLEPPLLLRSIWTAELDKHLTELACQLGSDICDREKMSRYGENLRYALQKALEVHCRSHRLRIKIPGACKTIIEVATALLRLAFMTTDAIAADAIEWANKYGIGLELVSPRTSLVSLPFVRLASRKVATRALPR